MAILVQKFGGSSVADEDKIAQVAKRVVAAREQGLEVVVVVSAMGKTTDQLLSQAHRIHPSPPRRELDMLTSAGERISMSLLCMAIQRLGHDAISFTGSQCGIITNDCHFDARIIEVRPFRIQDELARGRIVVVAGFQGMSYRREITTLGRGGSDTTAVALAAALDAEACEIYGDVDGIYSADPRLVPDARHIPILGYEEMQELSQSGAKVLNATAVEFAKEQNITLLVKKSDGQGSESIIRKHPPRAPGAVIGVAHEAQVRMLVSAGGDPSRERDLLALLDEMGISGKQLTIARLGQGQGPGTALAISKEVLPEVGDLRARIRDRLCGAWHLRDDLGAVSLIGTGINATFRNLLSLLALLDDLGLVPAHVHTSSFRISVLVDSERLPEVVRAAHAFFLGEQGA